MVEMIAFKLNDSATKKELNDYALRRGFASVADLARVAFYAYLDKAHYPFQVVKTAIKSDPPAPEGDFTENQSG